MKLFEMEHEVDNKYSRATRIPQYQIKGDCPVIQEMFNNEKTNKLLQEIRESGVSDEEKEFLRLAAYRHVQFRYDRIAEYYAHASKEMQELMEESALVIIDIDDAIANGYVKLSAKLKTIVDENKEK